jgi:hypothetical protein
MQPLALTCGERKVVDTYSPKRLAQMSSDPYLISPFSSSTSTQLNNHVVFAGAGQAPRWPAHAPSSTSETD